MNRLVFLSHVTSGLRLKENPIGDLSGMILFCQKKMGFVRFHRR